MSIICPLCDQSFEDGRGLHGHLRFKEGLSGEELEEVFEEAKNREEQKSGEDSGSSVRYDDPKMQAVEELRIAKKQLQKSKDRKEALRDSSGGGMTIPFVTTWQEVKGEVRDRINQEIDRREEKVQECIDRLDEEIQKEVDRRE